MKVQNSIAFVTGANRGLDLAFASELVARGAAAARCGDATLLVNNAGIVRLGSGALDPALIDTTREIFETNFYGMMRATQAFAPALSANGGGAIINVLSDATWFARPMLAAYSAMKSAAWSFTNALRIELREKGTQVLALHVGFLDTDMTKGFNMKKNDPRQVASRTLDGLENGDEEVIADEETNAIKRSLSTAQAYYMNPPDIV